MPYNLRTFCFREFSVKTTITTHQTTTGMQHHWGRILLPKYCLHKHPTQSHTLGNMIILSLQWFTALLNVATTLLRWAPLYKYPKSWAETNSPQMRYSWKLNIIIFSSSGSVSEVFSTLTEVICGNFLSLASGHIHVDSALTPIVCAVNLLMELWIIKLNSLTIFDVDFAISLIWFCLGIKFRITSAL